MEVVCMHILHVFHRTNPGITRLPLALLQKFETFGNNYFQVYEHLQKETSER